MRAARILATTNLVIGIIVFTGWIIENPYLKSIFPGLPSMNPLTAICLMLLSVSVLFATYKDKLHQLVVVTPATIATLLSASKLIDYTNVISLHLDQKLFVEQVLHPQATSNQLSVTLAFCLVSLGVSFFFSLSRERKAIFFSQTLAFFVVGMATVALASYFFTTDSVSTLIGFRLWAIHTAFGVLFSSVSLLFLTVNTGYFAPDFRVRTFMQNVPIATKINVIFVGIGILITVISIGRSYVFYNNFADMTERHIPKIDASYEMEINIKEAATDVYNYVAFHNPKYKKQFSENILEFDTALSNYVYYDSASLMSRNSGKLQRLGEDLEEKGYAVIAAVDQAHAINQPISSSSSTTELLTEFVKVSDDIDNLIDDEVQAGVLTETSFDRDVVAPSILFSSVVIIALLCLAVWLGTFLSRLIIKPLNQLTAAANQVSAGNLDVDMEISSQDEIGQLATTFLTMVKIVKNSQENMQAETERVKEQRVLLQTILDHIPLGVVFINASDRTIVSVNTEAQQVFQVSEIVVANMPYKMLFSGVFNSEGKPYPMDEFPPTKVLNTSREATVKDVVIERPDGSKVTVKVTATPIHDYQHRLESVVVLIEDVTKEREVDRMKNEFISLASHQLRTPLTAMRWFSEMLLSGDSGQLNDEQREYIQHISDSNERMIGLVNALLNISRIESGRLVLEPKLTHLGNLVETFIEELEPMIKEKNLTLTIDVPQDIPMIMIDPQLIRQVYVILITNAVKYNTNGGKVTVNIAQKNDMLVSEVSDTGVGIPEKDHEKVFTKFYRGENIQPIETEGTGLGLYLVKAIIDSSKGKVWFKSEAQKGTTFWFSLPISKK
jgi:two-component system, NtrC family, sensor histidine kinase KinB